MHSACVTYIYAPGAVLGAVLIDTGRYKFLRQRGEVPRKPFGKLGIMIILVMYLLLLLHIFLH